MITVIGYGKYGMTHFGVATMERENISLYVITVFRSDLKQMLAIMFTGREQLSQKAVMFQYVVPTVQYGLKGYSSHISSIFFFIFFI